MEYSTQHLSASTQRYTVLPCAVTIGIGMVSLVGFLILGWPLLGIPIALAAVVLGLLTAMMAKSELLTPEGNTVAGRVEGLKRYMLDFSDFSKRGVPDLSMWDFYMVYAAAFGISDTVAKQLRALYPQLNDPSAMEQTWDTSPVMYAMFYHPYFHTMPGAGTGAGDGMASSLMPDLGSMLSSNVADIQSAAYNLTHAGESSGGSGFGGGGFGGSSGGGGGGGMGGR